MTNCAKVAAECHKHLCEHDWHGYTQGSGRWGDGEGACDVWVDGKCYKVQQGDRDCSSSVIECWQLALEGTAYAGALGKLGVGGPTYTGNMKQAFIKTGLFEWKPMSFVAQKGDIYLNEASHTAMCQSSSPDMLSEFLINENGQITGGKTGDQTGKESVIRGYYNFPWDGILHYNGKADGVNPGSDSGLESVRIYRPGLIASQKWCLLSKDMSSAVIQPICEPGKRLSYKSVEDGAAVRISPAGSEKESWVLKKISYPEYPDSVVSIHPKGYEGLCLTPIGLENGQGVRPSRSFQGKVVSTGLLFRVA